MSGFDRNDLGRDPRLDPRVDPSVRNDGYGWGLPAIVIAAVLIIGGLWFANAGKRRDDGRKRSRSGHAEQPPGDASTCPRFRRRKSNVGKNDKAPSDFGGAFVMSA